MSTEELISDAKSNPCPKMMCRTLSVTGNSAVLHKATPERLNAFSDGVFAVLITVLVLELRPPAAPTFKALLALWPTWLSYALSYLFIAIVWTNHHYLLRYAIEASPRLLWFNFAHLFSMSLLPFSTAWMAVSKLAPQPVALYAIVFFLVNATFRADQQSPLVSGPSLVRTRPLLGASPLLVTEETLCCEPGAAR